MKRIPTEMDCREGVEKALEQWLAQIPSNPDRIDDAGVEQVQMILLKAFSFIRSYLADQIVIFAESFFKLPMLRRLEADMDVIELSEVDKQTYKIRREVLEEKYGKCKGAIDSLDDCINKIQAFTLKAKMM